MACLDESRLSVVWRVIVLSNRSGPCCQLLLQYSGVRNIAMRGLRPVNHAAFSDVPRYRRALYQGAGFLGPAPKSVSARLVISFSRAVVSEIRYGPALHRQAMLQTGAEGKTNIGYRM